MKRMWGMRWRRREDTKWKWASPMAFPKEVAVRVFQGSLLSAAFNSNIKMELAPIKKGATRVDDSKVDNSWTSILDEARRI